MSLYNCCFVYIQILSNNKETFILSYIFKKNLKLSMVTINNNFNRFTLVIILIIIFVYKFYISYLSKSKFESYLKELCLSIYEFLNCSLWIISYPDFDDRLKFSPLCMKIRNHLSQTLTTLKLHYKNIICWSHIMVDMSKFHLLFVKFLCTKTLDMRE